MRKPADIIPKPGSSSNSKDFTQGAVHTHLIRLTGYMVLGLISVMTAGLVETIYIGNLGTNELAALSFTFPLVMIFQGIAMGLSVGASSVVARTMGLGDAQRAKLLITHCFILVIALTLVFTALAYNNVGTFFSLLGANDKILPLTVSYMQIWLLGLPFFTVAMVGSTLMRAAGDAVTPGYLMTIGSVLHVTIAPFFIFGLMSAPEMGLAGAALGFLLARSVSFAMYSYVIIFRDKLIDLRFKGFFSSCRDILHVGLPAVASNLIGPISMSVITRLLAGHGVVVVAGFGVASRIEAMVMMVVFALSMSVAPFIGQNWGAALFDRVKLALKLANRFALLWGVVAYGILFVSAETLVSLINDDPGVIDAAVIYLRILPLAMGFMGITANATSTFNALGKPLPSLVISVLQSIVISIPLALLGDYLFGYIGIFMSGALTMAMLGIVSWFWIIRQVDTGIRRRS
ncbi:MAG TPA: MATE family efflux transporter [Pseudomonadales bacterium]|nr:MATE family efflux transporter [Pseudomonadales bacterium]